MTKEQVEMCGRMIVGVLAIALYTQATRYSPAISFSLLRQCGVVVDEKSALQALSFNLAFESIHDYVILPAVLKAERDQKIVDNLPAHLRANQAPILDRNVEDWDQKLSRVAAAVGTGALSTAVTAFFRTNMAPVEAMSVGAMTLLVCYGIKNFGIDTLAAALRQQVDAKAATMRSHTG